ncbi:uncharacterized protein BKA55DRAFT_355929 [Fusarium redolens]|uniref:Uncharacterized protein n=1 Tax=Fusarium redolens TaxID=48865 RepID=A0A9P9HC51_FUSRE|nr:uncharacterized protein BKA55DRAFT_355929 [Fusarium redolens]KAH7254198.1 hypothetical protein BKA55DRAFT_355929 [Fusarium redolens]
MKELNTTIIAESIYPIDTYLQNLSCEDRATDDSDLHQSIVRPQIPIPSQSSVSPDRRLMFQPKTQKLCRSSPTLISSHLVSVFIWMNDKRCMTGTGCFTHVAFSLPKGTFRQKEPIASPRLDASRAAGWTDLGMAVAWLESLFDLCERS